MVADAGAACVGAVHDAASVGAGAGTACVVALMLVLHV